MNQCLRKRKWFISKKGRNATRGMVTAVCVHIYLKNLLIYTFEKQGDRDRKIYIHIVIGRERQRVIDRQADR